ncbi:hypothetical protein ACI78V_09220 [Geodermatophilus sp. SYSU D00742]
MEAAVAQRSSELFAADETEVDQKFNAMDGIQNRYRDAKAAQQAAFDARRTQLKRIEDTLVCAIPEAERTRLSGCWDKVRGDAGSGTSADCAGVDALDGTALPTEIDALRTLSDTARTCVRAADQAFDRLVNVPATLGERLGDLGTRATALEQDVNGPRADPTRSFVEFLQMRGELGRIEADWLPPADYVCGVKAAFVVLLRRHAASIRVQSAVYRWDKQRELDEVAKGTKAKTLVDAALECFRSAPQEDGYGAAAAQEGGQGGSPGYEKEFSE